MDPHNLYIYNSLTSSKEKFDILKVEGDPPLVIGTYERVKKILERIEFSPARPGRPKTT